MRVSIHIPLPLAQQEHEAVFQRGRRALHCRAPQRSLKQALLPRVQRTVHEAHRAALRHGVHHAGHGKKPRLQRARRITRRRLRHARHARRKLANLLRCAARQRTPLVQQHGFAATLGFVQIRRADDDGHAAARRQARDDVPEFPARKRVHAHRRLIQQQQARRRHQRANQPELLLHAAGKLPRQPRREGRHGAHVQQFAVARRARGVRHALEVGVEVQVLLHAQVFIQAKLLRHVANVRLRSRRHGRRWRAARKRQRARIGAQQPGDDAQQRRFARTVGAEQRRHAPGRHGKRHAVQRTQRAASLGAELLDDALHAQHGRLRRCPAQGASKRTVAGMPRRRRFCGSSV